MNKGFNLVHFAERHLLCRKCPTPCAIMPDRMNPAAVCPLPEPRWGAIAETVGLGDVVEFLAKPFARALRLKCLDEKDNLKPESPCARRKRELNKVTLFKKAPAK